MPTSQLPQARRQQISRHPDNALEQIRIFMHKGKSSHNRQDYHSASGHFVKALELIKQLIELRPLVGNQRFLSLKIAASHNLCLSLSALGKLQKAEHVLKELHQSLLKLCLAPAIPKYLRISALGALDNSLFALTSNLGLQGKVDQLYHVISETDHVAELAAEQLLH
tara:strand:+ start:521 stop:1021 length:501 start_codon:yes stop_codon:yes gene_type:complete